MAAFCRLLHFWIPSSTCWKNEWNGYFSFQYWIYKIKLDINQMNFKYHFTFNSSFQTLPSTSMHCVSQENPLVFLKPFMIWNPIFQVLSLFFKLPFLNEASILHSSITQWQSKLLFWIHLHLFYLIRLSHRLSQRTFFPFLLTIQLYSKNEHCWSAPLQPCYWRKLKIHLE